MVALGPSFQIIRGIIIAVILLPIRDVILGEKRLLKLALLTIGLSFLSTIDPTPGSLDGYIYTTLPLEYHLLGIPEALFVYIPKVWYSLNRKYLNVIAIVLFILILFMSIAGYMQAKGLIE